MAIGVAALLTVPLLGFVFYRVGGSWKAFESAYWGGPPWITFLKTFGIMFIPTLLMGATFPLFTRLYTPDVRRVGWGIGTVYTVNTLGAIGGALAAGFLYMPLLGLHRALLVLSGLNVLLGGLLLARQLTLSPFLRAALAAGLSVIVAGTGLLVPTLRFRDIAGIDEREVLFYDEDAGGVVKVSRDANGRKIVSVNGWPVAGTAGPDDVDYPEIQKALGHLPLLLHAQPQRVLIIGFGAGGTSWAVSRYDVEEIECVELMPGVIRAAPYLTEVNHTVLADPRFRVILNDGRHHLLVTPKTYDVITVDATDPKFAGSANLYTREFYQLAYDHLAQGGMQELYATDPLIMLEGFAMGPATVAELVRQSMQLNTYNHPITEFFDLAWRNPSYENLWELSQYQDDPEDDGVKYLLRAAPIHAELDTKRGFLLYSMALLC